MLMVDFVVELVGWRALAAAAAAGASAAAAAAAAAAGAAAGAQITQGREILPAILGPGILLCRR